MSKYIGANIRRQDCLLQAKMLETDAPKVEGARRREGDMHRWCCTNMGASHSSMVTLAHMGDNRSSSSCFTAQAARPAKVSRCQGVVQPCWIQMAERGDNADLEWGQMVFSSPSQLRASQPNGPVGAPFQRLWHQHHHSEATLGTFLCIQNEHLKKNKTQNTFLDLVPCEVVPGTFPLWWKFPKRMSDQ